VEKIIGSHPHVLDAAVTSAPDDKWGERVIAFVVSRNFAETAGALRDRLVAGAGFAASSAAHATPVRIPQAATAIANALRYAESERERRTTEALADVARAVGESLRLGEVLRLILRHAVSLLNVEGACIALRTGDYLHIVAAIGSADVLRGVHLPVNASLIGRSVQSNELILVNEFGVENALNRSVQHLMRIQRTVIAPFVTGRGTIGAIAILNREKPFNAEDAKVLQRLADQVSVAIVNARLFEELEKATREWKVAFDSTASGLVVLEESLTVSRCNARAAELSPATA
jgi:transcriptional regulator with GAF, ATPase, and Fis domain